MPPALDLDIARIRAILRALHQSAPEAAASLEQWVDAQEARIGVLENVDPFRALVTAMLEGMIRSNGLIDDVRQSILAPLARAEEAKEQRRLIDARNESERVKTLRGVLSRPTILALVGVLTTGLTGLIALIQALLER